MKKILLSLLILIFAFGTLKLKAQVISFNTQTLGTGYTASNGSNGITFNIQNTNSFPAILTSVSSAFFSGGTSTFELWASSTNLTGLPGAIGTGTGWTLVATTGSLTVATGAQIPLFPTLNFTIPGNTHYRFYISSPSATIGYTTSTTAVTPNIFSNTGVNLLNGDYVFSGSSVGYGGPITGPNFNPRSFNGTVTLNLQSTPCSGIPTAGITNASSLNPCAGETTNFSLTGTTSAGNLGYQWLRSNTGNPGTWIALPGATNSFYSAIVTGTRCYRCVVTCLNSGLTDTSTTVCVTSQTWSPTSNCWCIPTYTSGSTAYVVEEVSLGIMTNNTASLGNPSPYRVDYTPAQSSANPTISIPTIYAGLTSTATVKMGSSTANYSGIWIDADHNGNFDTYEFFTSGLNAGTFGTNTIAINLPVATTLTGLTRMRVRGAGSLQMLNTQACGPTNSSVGEAEDYLVNILLPSPHDPAVTSISGPSGNCFTTCDTVTVTVANYGANNINLLTNPVIVTLNVNGPNGIVPYTQNVTTSTTLNAYGGNSATVTFPCVNMYNGGNYSINTSLSIGGTGGVVNGNLQNDSLFSGVAFLNYRPTPGPDFHVCQDGIIGFGQGMIATGCASTISDSVTISFNFTPSMDNVGATTGGTSQTVPGAGCANQFAGNIANALKPILPQGAFFTQNAILTVTNFSSTFPTEPRFILYSNVPVSPTLYTVTQQGYNVNAGNITLAGQSSLISPGVYRNVRHIPPAQVGSIFDSNPVLNVGYFETWNDNFAGSDVTFNAGGPTTVTLKIYYNYIPATVKWYDNLTSSVILDTVVPFNPLSPNVVNPTTQLTNTSSPGTFPFFVTCDGTDCRAQVNMVIDPTPSVIQSSMTLCESAPGSNQAIFDLTTMNGIVSGSAPNVNVSYCGDPALLSPIQTPSTDTTSSVCRFIVVTGTNGCVASDSLCLEVVSIPQFSAGIMTGSACAPSTVDVASLIQFAIVPTGSDTLYYSDAACTIPHPNPHVISGIDTVYCVFKTNTTPYCSDTAVAYINVTPASNLIAAQAPFNYSICGPLLPVTNTLSDGQSQTFYQTSDCRKIADVNDLANGSALGSTVVTEMIDCLPQLHNGQPYVNRHYEITPSNQDSATVCLYYLQDDLDIYDGTALGANFPLMTPANMTITKVSNGDLNTPGHTAKVIPSSAITKTFDPVTTVWQLCFMVDSFSHFYLHTANPNNVPLPVDLMFNGKRIENSSVLSWTTSREENNDYFVVEKSRDGRNFNALSNKINSQAVNGNSNIALQYNYTDATPNEGHNYYRLQQVDRDERVSQSKVVDVYFGTETMVTMYPNPVTSELNVDINVLKSTEAKMRIIDATGRVVKVVDMSLKAGGNIHQVSMDNLSDGIYLVTITNEKGLNYTQTIRKK